MATQSDVSQQTQLPSLNFSSPKEIILAWLHPISGTRSIAEWITDFYELSIGKYNLDIHQEITVVQLRELTNQYTQLFSQALQTPPIRNAVELLPEKERSIATKIITRPTRFSADQPETKTNADQEILYQVLYETSALITAIQKILNNKPGVTQTKFTDSSFSVPTQESSQALVSSVPSPPVVSNSSTSVVEQMTFSSQVFSTQAGFISNQVIGELCGLYGFPYDKLPKYLSSEIKNVVKIKLLAHIHGGNFAYQTRFQLGQQIFRDILQNEVGLLTTFKKEIIASATQEKINLSQTDPLAIEKQITPSERITLYEQAKGTSSEQTTPEEQTIYETFVDQAKRGFFSRTLTQSDTEFFTALTELSLSDIGQQLVIKNLITSYIYSFGIGPDDLLTSISSADLSRLFGVQLADDNLENFKHVISSYWQYQKTYLENLSGTRFIPNRNLLLALQNNTLDNKQLSELGQIGIENAKLLLTSQQYTTDSRFPVLSTMVTTNQLVDEKYRKKILTTFRTFYPDLSSEQQTNLASKNYEQLKIIHEKQRNFYLYQLEQELTQKQLKELLKLATTHAILSANQKDAINQYLIIEKLSRLQQQNAINQLTQAFAIQQLLSLLEDIEIGDTHHTLLNRIFTRNSRRSSFVKAFKRGRTLGRSIKNLETLTSLYKKNPQASISNFIGKNARKLLGDEIGDTLEQILNTSSTVGLVLKVIPIIMTIVSSLGALIIPVLTLLGGLGIGSILINAATTTANAAGSLTGMGKLLPGSGSSTISSAATETVASKSAFSGSSLLAGSNISPTAITGGLACGAAATAICLAATNSALLKPLPTITDNEVSPYLTIVKSTNLSATKIEESQLPVTVTYSITISADKGYAIEINSMSDVLTAVFDTEQRPEKAASPQQTIRTRTDTELLGTTPNYPIILLPGETLTIPAYQETYGPEYLHSNLTNLFTIGFTATKTETNEVVSGKQAKTAVVLCLGECPQKAGCWPASGWVRQSPFGSFSHPDSDAFDISNTIGTPVYATFPGSTFQGEDTTSENGGFGLYVTLTIQLDGQARRLMYGHLSQAVAGNMGHIVPEGTQIGLMGSSGNSTGSHLHYELDKVVGGISSWSQANSAQASELRTIIAGPPDGSSVQNGQFVVSCYDP